MSNEMSRAEYDQAKQDFVAGNYGNALALLDKLAQKFPSEKEILHSRAQCLAKLERAEEAVAACDQLTTIYSDPRGEQLRAALISAGAQSPSVNPLSAHRRAGSFPVRKAALTSGIAVAVIAAVAASYWSLHTDYDPTKPYIIHFPKEQSAGKVRNALSPEGAWSGESPAQGDYTLPAGFVLHLELNEDGARDYSFLTRVAPEVLVSVSCFAENLTLPSSTSGRPLMPWGKGGGVHLFPRHPPPHAPPPAQRRKAVRSRLHEICGLKDLHTAHPEGSVARLNSSW